MGIRIHKIMGYGFADIKTSKSGRISDPRFNKSFVKNMYELDGFSNWLKANKKEASIILTTIFGFRSHQALFAVKLLTSNTFSIDLEKNDDNIIYHDPEYGLENVMILVPPDSNGWSRYDDIIDYVEATGTEPKIVNLFEEKKMCGIYPHDHMVLIPGRKNIVKDNNGIMNSFEYRSWAILNPDNPANIVESLKNDWVPKIPESLLLYSIYAKMFIDPLTVYQLRPMIYTYWG